MMWGLTMKKYDGIQEGMLQKKDIKKAKRKNVVVTVEMLRRPTGR